MVQLYSRPARVPQIQYRYDRTPAGVLTFSYTDNAFTLVGPAGTSTATGTSVPSWRYKVEHQQDASSIYSRIGYSGLKTDFISGTSYTRNAAGILTKISQGFFYGMGGHVPAPITTDVTTRLRALKKAKAQLAEFSHRARAMEPLAEARDLQRTIRGSIDLTKKFLGAALAIKKKRSLRDFRRFMSDAWLTYTFGISPMVRDTKAIAASIAEFLGRTDSVVQIEGRATTYGKFNDPNYDTQLGVQSSAPSGCKIRGHAWGNYKISYRFVGGYSLNLLSSNNYTVMDQLGLNLSAIPGTLWELLGLSWIVDYFVNVGDYLDDMFYSPPGNTIYLVENRSYKLDYDTNFFMEVNPRNPLVTLTGGTGGNSRVSYFEFSRTPLAALPHQSIRLKITDEVGNFGLSKLLNLVTLLK